MKKENTVEKYLEFYSSKLGKRVLEQEARYVESKLKNHVLRHYQHLFYRKKAGILAVSGGRSNLYY